MLSPAPWLEAATHFRAAADKGNEDAMHNLASLYENGLGCERKDLREAHALYKRAAELGQDKSGEALERLAPLLAAEEGGGGGGGGSGGGGGGGGEETARLRKHLASKIAETERLAKELGESKAECGRLKGKIAELKTTGGGNANGANGMTSRAMSPDATKGGAPLRSVGSAPLPSVGEVQVECS